MNKKIKLSAGAGVVLSGLIATMLYLRHTTVAVLEPRGIIAHQERSLLFFGLIISLVIVIPVFGLTFFIVWKYRESNTKATYSPDFDHSRIAETIWWVVPSILIVIISVVTWNSSHSLDPFRPIASAVPPITIQVVALDWKWLFIYPEQHIASVNMVQFPVNTPVNFVITSDAPMNSFWIPQLGGQIYAMPGMSTSLHLSASQTGSFRGSTANISGRGFADMVFTAKASTDLAFKQWVNDAKQSVDRLTFATYNQLAKPSSGHQVAYYSSDQLGLFDTVVLKYMTPGMEGIIR